MDKSPDAFRTISEVADYLETPAHVLRFWESRFPQIKPVKRAGGRRYYRPADVALLAGIRQLLHTEGMTIRGVQKILRDQGVSHVIGLSGQAFDGGADLDLETLDSALDAVEDPPEPETNIVALTDWRSASETGETPAALREAISQSPAEMAVPDAPLPSLFAEDAPEADMPEDDPLSPAAVPLQWSLFDMPPETATEAAPTPSQANAPPVVMPAEDLLEALPVAPVADVAEQLAEAEQPQPGTTTEPIPAIGGDSTPTVTDALPAIVNAPFAMELPPSPAMAPTEPAPLKATEPAPPAELDTSLPWLPPRLRALRKAKAKPDPALVTLLARARALRDVLNDAHAAKRG